MFEVLDQRRSLTGNQKRIVAAAILGGLVTAFIPIGVMIGSLLAGYLTPELGWRGLFAVGVLPGLAVLVVRMWVPESPRWLLRQGRVADAKTSLAWALEIDPASLP